MKAIVAVYDDWGIGCNGTQPVAVSADRKFFRSTTAGAAVIVGRRTLEDFPGGRPLPKRLNIVLSRQNVRVEGALVAHTPQEARDLAGGSDKVFVIGGGSVYRQMLPMCDEVYVTKVHATPPSDTFFPNLDADPQWDCTQILESGEEEGIRYEMCLYRRKEI